MGKEIPLELRFQVEERFITGSVTFDELARQTGISSTQLRHWADTDDWRGKRAEYRKAFADIRRKKVQLRQALVQKCLETLNPMQVFALTSLESQAAKEEKSGAPDADPVTPDGELSIRTPAEAVDALKGAIETKLQRLLTQPDGISLGAIKDFKSCLDLLEKMQAKVAPEDAGQAAPQTLSEERIKELRETLGL